MAIIKKPTPSEMALARLRAIYLQAEQDIIREITRKRDLGLVDYGEVASLQRVQGILQNMNTKAEEYVPKMVETYFYTAEQQASAPAGYANALTLTSTQTDIAETLVGNLLADITEASQTAYESAEEYLRIGRQEAGLIRQTTLELLTQGEASGKGWRTVQNQMAAELNAKGVTAFVDKAGRKWSLESYCSMATRTTGRQAQVAAALTSDDWDLWQISKIGSTCPLCSVYEGRVYSKSGTDPDYPPLAMAFGKIDPAGSNDLSNTWLNIHPNCLVPGGFVLAEGLMSESRRLYRGEVVTLETSRGNKITVTPNHPVLTNRGFVAAGMIKESDKVIETRRKYRRFLGKAPNDIYTPSIVDEVFHARLKSISSATHTVKGSAVQFHGDGGSDSEVSVILADRFGINIVNILRGEPGGKSFFPSAHSRGISLFAKGTLFKIVKRTLHALYCGMRGLRFVLARERVTVNGEQLSDLRHGTSASPGNLCVGKTFIVKLQKVCKLLFVGFTKGVGHIAKLFATSCAATPKTKNHLGVMNMLKRNSEFLSYLPSGETLLKKRLERLWIDNCIVESTVVHVSTSYYDGYVYNLETEANFYVYNSIVTHNCLHSLVRYTTAGKSDKQIQAEKDFSSFEKRPADVDYRTKKQIEAYRKKEADRARYRADVKQFEKYKAAGVEGMPVRFETFEKHKLAGDDVYKGWESKFRGLNSQAKRIENAVESGIMKVQAGGSSSISASAVRIPNKVERARVINEAINADKPIYAENLRVAYLANGIKPRDGLYDVVLHGSPHYTEYEDLYRLDNETLSYIISGRKDWKGSDIRLISCSTGYKDKYGNCVAQYLANQLGVNVYAPIDTVFIERGALTVGREGLTEQEGFIKFTPKRR